MPKQYLYAYIIPEQPQYHAFRKAWSLIAPWLKPRVLRLYSITLDLTPDVQERAVAQARTEGIAVELYLQALIETGLPTEQAEQVRRRNHERNAAAIAPLDAFLEDDSWSDAEEQSETRELLRQVVDEDHPGQRRVFGHGYNL